VFRPDNPYVALGLAVSHLMTKPAFATLRFGEWSRILVGQINRKRNLGQSRDQLGDAAIMVGMAAGQHHRLQRLADGVDAPPQVRAGGMRQQRVEHDNTRFA
jgi:hypothetical protein